MDDNRWWGWAALIVLFLAFKALRALFGGAKGSTSTGMARLNAAAERILKERSGANPLPRTTQKQARSQVPLVQSQSRITQPKTTQSRSNQAQTSQARSTNTRTSQPGSSPLTGDHQPAVIRRRTGLLGDKEPVIQRRH
jgi:hypothetical protein